MDNDEELKEIEEQLNILKSIVLSKEIPSLEVFVELKSKNTTTDYSKNTITKDNDNNSNHRGTSTDDDITLKRFRFWEDKKESKKNGTNIQATSFRDELRKDILDSITKKYLSSSVKGERDNNGIKDIEKEDIEYYPVSDIANNQNGVLYIIQDDNYKPFKFLDCIVGSDIKISKSDAYNFKEDDIDNAKAFIFRFKLKDNVILAYQTIHNINIPNKKKNNFLVKAIVKDKNHYFERELNRVIAITKKVDVLIVNNVIFTTDIPFMQRNFKFNNYINKQAIEAISLVENMGLVCNLEKLNDYIQRDSSDTNKNSIKYRKKILQIKNFNVKSMTSDALIDSVNKSSRWQNVFTFDNYNKIVLNHYTDVEHLIDLLTEKYTKSLITGDEFETDVKKVVSKQKETKNNEI